MAEKPESPDDDTPVIYQFENDRLVNTYVAPGKLATLFSKKKFPLKRYVGPVSIPFVPREETPHAHLDRFLQNAKTIQVNDDDTDTDL